MELVKDNLVEDMIALDGEVVSNNNSAFIGANTQEVSLNHLKNDCIIPVFAKDNESTISHHEFIYSTLKALKTQHGSDLETKLSIRVSHQIKGRVPSAIGKPVKELREDEKTQYYERMAFVVEIPHIKRELNGQELSLCIGGVRGYNLENLYSKKSLEKFKLFIGFQNSVCTNLCIATDGFTNSIRVSKKEELVYQALDLFRSYSMEDHFKSLEEFHQLEINENQFGHLLGKMKMYQYLDKQEKKELFPLQFNDSHINNIAKMYFQDGDFKNINGTINLWNLYNLFTGAVKSSYIDVSLERNKNAYELVQYLGNSIKTKIDSYFLHH